ncbi:MAG: hypothetical protein GKC05_07835 [Methanomicrobiales archaeon]|nr:hypothetical protein [Methanomicrobiales archaeon]NYT21577.1 hypothetical protein [Methanomicrobiales archaeon]
MALSLYLQPVSILIEVVICALCIAIAVIKKQIYGWFIALTFAIYVVYDFSAFSGVAIPDDALALIFLAATISMLYAVWTLYSRE